MDKTSEFIFEHGRPLLPCKLPLRFIKDRFMEEAKSHRPKELLHDRGAEVWNAGIETIEREVDEASTFEELNHIFLSRGRISLHEWIESL